jgi:hypothetical protein
MQILSINLRFREPNFTFQKSQDHHGSNMIANN